MISTRGRYAIRVILDMAENGKGAYLPLKDIAARQEISLKYLEQIMPSLIKGGLVEAASGKGGGYKLLRDVGLLSVGEVLRLTEGSIAPVACLSDDAKECERASACKTLNMWKDYYRITAEFFDSITFSELMEGGRYA